MTGERNPLSAQSSLQALTNLVIQEILGTFHIGQESLSANIFRPILYFPALKFARLAYQIDQNVGQVGMHKAAMRTLDRFVASLDIRGYETPTDCPLLVISNHPGGTDPFVLPAGIQRADLHIVSLQHTIFSALPNIYKNLIILAEDRSNGQVTFKEIIRILKDGNSVLLYPGGDLEPDPSIFPKANDYIQKWSKSAAQLLCHMPELAIQPMVIRGTISSQAWRSFIAKFGTSVQTRLQIAMIYQIAVQQFFKNAYPVQTTIIKGHPLKAIDIDPNLQVERVYKGILLYVSELLSADPERFPLLQTMNFQSTSPYLTGS